MSSKKTPLQVVTEKHGGKEKLVDRIMGLVERGEAEQAEVKRRLLSASNRKLLRISTTLETIQSKFGSREKLAATVAELLGKAKDGDYRRKLDSFTSGRLLDMATSLARRAGTSIGATKRPVEATAAAKPAKAEKPATKTARAPKAKTEGAPKRKAPAAKAKKTE